MTPVSAVLAAFREDLRLPSSLCRTGRELGINAIGFEARWALSFGLFALESELFGFALGGAADGTGSHGLLSPKKEMARQTGWACREPVGG